MLLGIPLKNNKHLGNLGSLRLGKFLNSEVDDSRLDNTVRHCNCCIFLPIMAIRTKTSSCWTEVRRISRQSRSWLTTSQGNATLPGVVHNT